jgi:hypothetical protein
MSTIYLCVDCENHYCVDCDGGEDSCSACHTGPRCNDCTVEHEAEHGEGPPPYDAATATGMYDREEG